MVDKKIRGNFPASEGMMQVNSVIDLKLLSETDVDTVSILYHTTINDGGQGTFIFEPLSSKLDDGGTVIIPTYPGFGGVGRWIRQLNIPNEVTPQMFGIGITPTSTTAAIQAALNWQNTATYGSFTVRLPGSPNGVKTKYFITGTGPRILQIQDQTRLIGSSLEGTFIEVDPGSTSSVVIEDNGSAAKIEMYNLQIGCAGNTNVTAIIQLGFRIIQFGTYGSLDNIMCRDAPNGIGFNLNVNIVACGKLYTSNTKSGLISFDGGSGLHIETFTPIEFSDIGIQLSIGDSVNYVETEAPTLNTAIPVVLAGNASINNMYFSIQSGRTVETMVKIINARVSQYKIENSRVNLSGTAQFGNKTNPAFSGTATGGSGNTVTDTTLNLKRNQLLGGAVFITGGTGAGQFAKITGNSIDTIYITTGFNIVPDNTSTYALDYLVKLDIGGGNPFTENMTTRNSVTMNAFNENTTTNILTVGNSNNALPISNILSKVVSLTFPSIPANSSMDIVTTLTGAVANSPVLLGNKNILHGLTYNAFIDTNNNITIRVFNLTGLTISPPIQTFIIMVIVKV